MIGWDFYSKRRNVSLSKFLEGIKTLPEAVDFFKQKKIHPPTCLKEFYEKVEEVVPAASATVAKAATSPAKTSRSPRKKQAPKTTKTTRTRRKTSPRKKEPVQETDQEQAVETKNEKKQYFRKIIKPEKK